MCFLSHSLPVETDVPPQTRALFVRWGESLVFAPRVSLRELICLPTLPAPDGEDVPQFSQTLPAARPAYTAYLVRVYFYLDTRPRRLFRVAALTPGFPVTPSPDSQRTCSPCSSCSSCRPCASYRDRWAEKWKGASDLRMVNGCSLSAHALRIASWLMVTWISTPRA